MNAKDKWQTSRQGIKYFYLYNYYPLCLSNFDATEDDWYSRRLVWNFKNDKNRISPKEHEQALNTLVPQIAKVLRMTFGDSLKNITLACVPASSKQKNQDRYEEFSRRLCNETGMQNAFQHIRITRDATPKHQGGNGNPDVAIDNWYFQGRTVLVFDDVTTTGNSLYKYITTLEKSGAKSVGGLCIAKTKHERQDGNPIDDFYAA